MPRSSGTYTAPASSWNPATSGNSATVADWIALLADLSSAMTQSMAVDGQSTVTGNIPMGGFKFTGLAAGTAAGNSLRWEQLFSQGAATTLASAGTTDIGAVNSVAVEITGTTTITSLGTNYNGPRFLRFTGILTLTHNATTLNLPGAASITTVAGDTCIAYPNSAANGWNIVAYQRASVIPVLPIESGQCQLQYLSASSLKLVPYNGNLMMVAGKFCTVPDAGVTLAAAPAAANTNYYIYAVATAGVITSLEASTTAYVVDTTLGNNGIRVKSGDATRSLVGLARGNGSTQWTDTAAQRFVRSWFNDNGKEFEGSQASSSTTNSVFTEISSAGRIEGVFWSGERVSIHSNAYGYTSSTNNTAYAGIGLDGATVATNEQSLADIANSFVGMATTTTSVMTEGYHYFTPCYRGTAGFTATVASMLRGNSLR